MAITPSYSTKQTLTCDLASLASSSTFVAGRESTAVDNSSNLYSDVLVEGKIRVGTTPTVNTEIQIWVYASFHTAISTANLDALDGTDSAETMTSAGVRGSVLALLATLDVDSTTSNVDYFIRPSSIAALFNGNMPKFWGVFVTHNTGVALNSTSGNHELSWTGLKYDVA